MNYFTIISQLNTDKLAHMVTFVTEIYVGQFFLYKGLKAFLVQMLTLYEIIMKVKKSYPNSKGMQI